MTMAYFMGFIKPELMGKGTRKTKLVILTVGHSNRDLPSFIGLLRAHDVKRVVDVRTMPRSRHNPQFNRDSLPRALRAVKIAYRHLAGLGGLRHAHPDSVNKAWRNASFRGYADYMQTDAFMASLQKLVELAAEKRTAIMCAEAVPWRCHRSLIADALLVRGISVEHIMSGKRRNTHTLTPWARVKGKRITYPE
jgi:uncharacterized protein (DUF488 family)